MSNSNLHNTQTFLAAYKQYKHDTEYIAGWLAETARFLGQKISEADNVPSKTKAKAKGGKNKKNHSNNKKANNGGGGGKRYLIRVSDFVPMAETIANNTESVLVPVALCKLFNRAIQARRRVAAWFETRAVQGEADSNKHHQHFITVLEDAFRLLQPFISSGPQANRIGGKRVPSEALAMENKFAGLSLEDAAELAEDDATDEMQLPVVTPVLLKHDETEIEEELKFAIGFLFDELSNMRTVACEQWRKYKAKQVDLIVAAMTAHTTVKLAQKAEAEFDLVVTRPKKYPTTTYPAWKLVEVLAKPSATKQSKTDEDKNRPGDMFWPTYLGLKYYLDRIAKWDPARNLPAIVPKDFGDRQPDAYTLRAIELAQIIRINMFGKRPAVKDMHSQALEHMFLSKQLPIWVTFAVELLFQSQDVLDDIRYHPFVELALHTNRLVAQNNRMLKNWGCTILPRHIHDDAVNKLGIALQDCQDWVLFGGYQKQWQELSEKKQLAAHPVLKKLLDDADEYYPYLRTDPILCGMLKYEIYLKYQSAGLKLEHQTLSIAMLAYIYIAGHLVGGLEEGETMPAWADMEYVIYAQDPEWLFHGGRPKTIKELRSKFLLASGSSAVNQARDLRVDRFKINVNKLRELRDTTVFGRGVYLPSDKFKTSEYNVSTAEIENVFKRLVDAMNSPQPWGRLARHMLQCQDENAQEQEQQAASFRQGRMGSSHKILESYAQWLQADMADLFFDWLEMGHYCGDIWTHIARKLETLDEWDKTSFGDKPAMEPTNDILLGDENFPQFLMAAYGVLQEGLTMPLWYNNEVDVVNVDSCLITLGRYHRASAIKLLSPGPLHLSNFYVDWKTEDWEPRWMSIKDAQVDELREMFYDSNEHVLRNYPPSAIKDSDDLNSMISAARGMPIVREKWDFVYEASLKLGAFPEVLNGKRAYASREDAYPDIEAEYAAKMELSNYRSGGHEQGRVG